MYRFLILLTLQSLLVHIVIGQEKLPAQSPVTSLFSDNDKEIHVTQTIIWSEAVQDHFKLFISLPPNYDSLRAEKYPVIYFLDGANNSFHHINYQHMEQGLIPEVITIGIGYPDSNQRNRDYTFGFNDFYKFMKQELVPKLDKTYHINPHHRTLFGHSYGGLCVLLTLFEYYDFYNIPFHNLIAASPSIWYADGQLAFVREEALYKVNKKLPVNLYMGVGSMEGFMITDLQKMKNILEQRNYQYLKLTSEVFEGYNHNTASDITYKEGIQWIFNQHITIPTFRNDDLSTRQIIATNLYPNPVGNFINLTIPSSTLDNQHIDCTITHTNGQKIKNLQKHTNGQSSIQIPVDELSQGTYLLQLSNGKEHQTLKFIKQ